MAGVDPSKTVEPPFQWSRRGIALTTLGELAPGWSDHCQMPTPLILESGILRMYYCSRDEENRSHVFYADLEAKPPFQIANRPTEPCLSPSAAGYFDASGVMPTSVIKVGSEIWLYYIGWSVRADVPYHNAIGLAVSNDDGMTFSRRYLGPIVGTSANEPFFCSTADVMRTSDGWLMWYASTTEWREFHGKKEPRYHLKVATSDDGIVWDFGRRVAVNYSHDDEAAVARATVFKGERYYHMWFCSRDIEGYRDDASKSYRLGYARSSDGLTWQRAGQGEIFAARPKEGAFDEGMQAYPAICQLDAGLILFYNGNNFGQTGIGYAIAK